MPDETTGSSAWKANLKARYADFLAEFEQQRDELKLQLHLGKAEAREEWDKLQVRIDELKAKAERIDDELDDTGDRVEAAAKEAFEELKAGVKRIRSLF